MEAEMRYLILERVVLAHNVTANSPEEAKKVVNSGKSKGVFQDQESIISVTPMVFKKDDDDKGEA